MEAKKIEGLRQVSLKLSLSYVDLFTLFSEYASKKNTSKPFAHVTCLITFILSEAFLREEKWIVETKGDEQCVGFILRFNNSFVRLKNVHDLLIKEVLENKEEFEEVLSKLKPLLFEIQSQIYELESKAKEIPERKTNVH